MRVFLNKTIFLLLFLTTALFSDVVLESKNQNIELLNVPFYEDKSGDAELSDVQLKEFITQTKKVASYGFGSSVYWFKINLSAKEDAKQFKWWLNISYPLLDKLDLYICDAKGTLLALKKSGKARPFSEREVKDRNFIFQVSPMEEQVLYLRVDTQSSMQVPMRIQTSESLFSDRQYILLLSGLYYGIFILIFFYNLISFIYTRSRRYFLYLLFVSSFALWQLSLDGLGIEFFWSECDWMIMHGSGTMMGIMIFTVIMFSRDFLNTRFFTPKIDRLLALLAILISLFTIAALFRPYGELVLVMAGTSVFLPPLLLATGIIAYRKKFYPARFYIIGWGAFLFGSALFAMNKFAWIEGVEFLSYAQQIGSALEMIFLSWALADLLKQSEREYLEKLSGLNTLLQDKIDNTLSQIRRHDQVLIEKSRLAAMGEMIEQIAHQWRQPLHVLALINQNLYFKTQLKTVTKEDYEEVHDKMNAQLQYMSQTIEDFRNFSKPNKKKERFFVEEAIKSALNLSEGNLKYAKVKVEFHSEEEHAVFGMRHEMMQVFMNLIKNVNDVFLEKEIPEPWIKFSVSEEENQIQIRVEDNAGGIDPEIIERVFQPYFSTKEALGGSGIGLYMSKEIIEKSMLGKISVKNSEVGAVFTILLPKSTPEVSLD